MYHVWKSSRKRKQKKRLTAAIFLVTLCLGLACSYLWVDSQAVEPEIPWIFGFKPQSSQIRKKEVFTIVLPAQTVFCPDLSLPVGSQKVLQDGEDGELRCTAEVTYENGQEISRTILSHDFLRQPVDRIIAQGRQEEGKIEIKNGYIRLSDSLTLTYTHTVTAQASAYPQASGSYPMTAGGKTLCLGIAAVDPDFISPGTRLFVTACDGSFLYGIARTIDSGRKGNRIELYFPTAAECTEFGERMCSVYFLG